MKYAIGIFLILTGIIALCFLSYRLGESKAKIKIVEKQVEVIKYVEKKKAKIYSKPNASRDDIIKLMRAGLF